MQRAITFLLFSMSIFYSTCVLSSSELSVGKGFFWFVTAEQKKVRVWYFQPEDMSRQAAVTFVMHGMKRNAERYLDQWVRNNNDKNSIVIAPEFSSVDFPKSDGYILGNMYSGYISNPAAVWTFSAIEDIFDYVRRDKGLTSETYNIYGHSAGAQFVHRLLLFRPDARINIAVAANAGWYTLPIDTIEFPYGLKNSPSNVVSSAKAFSKKLIILLGEEDNDPDHRSLRKTQEAMEQGEHRFSRGYYFYNTAKQQAVDMSYIFNWQLVTVPNVAHKHSAMSHYAKKLLNEEN